jgi:oxygen-independent coproporphyrinogen-3 oxidase
VDRIKLAEFRAWALNRLSLGFQAAQDRLLARLGRIHSLFDFLSAVDGARAAGFENISADLMSGLPGQRADDLVESVRAAAGAGCGAISLYALSVEPGTPLAAMRDGGSLEFPGEEDQCAMEREAREALSERGYDRYEISNYAREGRACRHNLNYWDNGEYIGLGCGAASHWEGVRWKNTADLDRYLAAMGRMEPEYEEWEKPEAGEAAFEMVMLALRTAAGLDLSRYRRRHGRDFWVQYGERAARLVRCGLAETGENRFALTDRGMGVQNQALNLSDHAAEFMSKIYIGGS